jgi:hypothetical protein
MKVATLYKTRCTNKAKTQLWNIGEAHFDSRFTTGLFAAQPVSGRVEDQLRLRRSLEDRNLARQYMLARRAHILLRNVPSVRRRRGLLHQQTSYREFSIKGEPWPGICRDSQSGIPASVAAALQGTRCITVRITDCDGFKTSLTTGRFHTDESTVSGLHITHPHTHTGQQHHLRKYPGQSLSADNKRSKKRASVCHRAVRIAFHDASSIIVS